MNTLSAREMFKQEEKTHSGKSYSRGEQRVSEHGKINTTTAFRIIERIKWIYTNSKCDVEVIELNDDGTYTYDIKPFWDETEPSGGKIMGKRYKAAMEYAHEYINQLKGK